MWGFTNSNFKLNLKVSALYLENKKGFIPKKIFFGRTAKVHPKDGVSRLNFPEGFGSNVLELLFNFSLVPFQMALLLQVLALSIAAVAVCLSLFPCLFYKPQALLSIWTNAIALERIPIWAGMKTWETRCTNYNRNTQKQI